MLEWLHVFLKCFLRMLEDLEQSDHSHTLLQTLEQFDHYWLYSPDSDELLEILQVQQPCVHHPLRVEFLFESS